MTADAPERDRLLSVSEAAQELGVHPVTVHGWVREGLVPSIQPGGRATRWGSPSATCCDATRSSDDTAALRGRRGQPQGAV